MRPNPQTKHPLRCTCNQEPLLAMYGRDKNGDAYIHVRIYKGNRVYGEIYTTHPISLLCRLCGMWWNINIVNQRYQMNKRKAPASVELPKPKM